MVLINRETSLSVYIIGVIFLIVMNRRRFLMGSAVGLALLAGCTSSDSDLTPTEQTTTTSDLAQNSPTGVPAHFEVKSVEPDLGTVTYGDEYSATITVANTGEQSEQFWGEIVEQRGPAWAKIGTLREEIGPDESVSEEYSWLPTRVGTVSYGILEVETNRMLTQWQLIVEAPSLERGSTFFDPAGWEMRVSELELVQSFEAVNEKGAKVTATAPTDSQWAFVHLTTENPSTDPLFVPGGNDLELIVNKQQVPEVEIVEVGKYDPYVNPTQQDGYYTAPSQILPGVVENGWRLFAVPDEVTTDDIEVVVYWDEMGVRISWV